MKTDHCRVTLRGLCRFFSRLALASAAGLFCAQSSSAGTVSDIVGYDPSAAPDNATSFDLEGCNLDKATEGTYNPPGTLICDTSATWPATDDSYTDGNLGKQWAELDLVPHRFGADSSGAPNQTYQAIIGADNLVHEPSVSPPKPLAIGYDVIAKITFNPSLSTGSAADCQLSLVGGNQIGDFGIGGAIKQIVQLVEITQTADTTCVWDYVEQLAITSSNISGSSNRSYFVAATGAQSIPIPSDIQPQALSKTMSAVENSLIKWTIGKIANPVSWDFKNTCNIDVPNTKDVVVDVTLTKGATEAGDLTATSLIKATNPSSRDVTYDCTDSVYGVKSGESSESLLDTKSFVSLVEPGEEYIPNNGDPTDMTGLEHILPPGSRQLRDEVACDIKVDDPLNPGQLITVGTLTAKYSLPDDDIGDGEVVNEQVNIKDVEDISGDHYKFSATKTSGFSGAFQNGYVEGTDTTDPVTWLSDPQSTSGTVKFTKTVTVDRGYDVDGKLSDTASVDLTDVTDVEATASTTFTTDPKIDLVINKKLGFTVTNDTKWKFEVKDSGGVVKANVEITISGGSASGSVTVYDLDPGKYTVTETALPAGWKPTSNPQDVTLSLPSCSGSVDFTNNPADNFYAQVEVKKITDPAGSEAGWDFTANSNNADNGATVTTTDGNFIKFNLDGGNNPGADAGNYSVTETAQSGWDQASKVTKAVVGCLDSTQNETPAEADSCSFSAAYTADAGCTFQCTFKNVQRGTIIVEKQTDPDGSSQTFEFTGDAKGTIGDGQQIKVENLVPGTYTSTEVVPDDWDLTKITCDDGSSLTPSSGDTTTNTATFKLDPGETVKCTFYDRERGDADVVKTVSGQVPPAGTTFDFEVRSGASTSAVGTTVASCTTDANGMCTFSCVAGDPPCRDVAGVAKMVPGDYQFCETGLPVNWTTSITSDPSYFTPNSDSGTADNSVYCLDFTLSAGESEHFTVDNTPPPEGDGRTIGYWKNWTSCDGHGKQAAVMDQWLATATECGAGGILLGEYCVNSCEEAVAVLDKRDTYGRKQASDPCFNAASQELGAKLNQLAGVSCPALVSLLGQTDADLIAAGFDGDRCMLNKKKDADLANSLNTDAGYLDGFNNNEDVCF